jgi:hypothetical protein
MVEFVDISAWVNTQKGRQDTVVKDVVMNIDKGVSMRSPILTGRFKGNWMLGINFQPSGKDLEKFDKSPLGTVGKTVNEHESQLPRLHAAGKVYYLVNNLSYANLLEHGHSWQTNRHSAGIVGLTLVEFSGVVDRAMVGVR